MEIGLILEHTPLGNRRYKGSWNIGTYNKLTLPSLPFPLSLPLLVTPNESLNLCLPDFSMCYLFPSLTFLSSILCLLFFISSSIFFLINHFFSVSIFQILMSSSSFSSQLHGSPASCVFPLGGFVLLDTLQITLATFHLYPTWLQVKVLSQSFYLSMTSPRGPSSRPKLPESLVTVSSPSPIILASKYL